MDKPIKSPTHYLPRDISWMYFNHRILQEARRKEVPLLERLSFLGIYSNNLDEFFRVRVATQNRVLESDEKVPAAQRGAVRKVLKQIARLSALDPSARADAYDLKEDRADVIVPAAEIFLRIAEVVNAEYIHVPVIGLADGIIDGLCAKGDTVEME